MCNLVFQSQADIASAYASELDTAILNRSILNEPFTPHSPNIPSFTFGGSEQRQYTDNNVLPSLPDLFSGPPPEFGSYSQLVNFPPQYQRNQHYAPLSPAANYDQSWERPSWSSTGLEPAFTPFAPIDSAVRAQEPHSSVAPPRTQQQPRPSSLTTHTQLPQPNRSAPETPSDDYYLAALADNNFSSPSLPPINSSPLPPSRPHSSVPKPLEVGERMPMVESGRRSTSKAGLVDLTRNQFEQGLDYAFGVDPVALTMPRKRTTAVANGESGAAGAKRRRTTQTSPSSSNRAAKSRRRDGSTAGDASLLTDDELSDSVQDGHETIDLSNASEVPQEFMAPTVDKRVKIGAFQCVICMDNCAHLTVTHCGMSEITLLLPSPVATVLDYVFN